MMLERRSYHGLFLIGLALTGCAALPHVKFGADRIESASRHNPVVNIVCLWEPSEGHAPSGLPARGFAGQVMFFTNGSASPVNVDGDVTIYEFDDFGTPEEQTRPLHVFRFDSFAWNAHRRRGTLGPAYSVFVPHMRDHYCRAECALRIRFAAPDGRIVFSDMANITLKGPDVSAPDSAVRTAGFDSPASETREDIRNADFAIKDEPSIIPHRRNIETLTIRPRLRRTAVAHAERMRESQSTDEADWIDERVQSLLQERGLQPHESTSESVVPNEREMSDPGTSGRSRISGRRLARPHAVRNNARTSPMDFIEKNHSASVKANAAADVSFE